MTRKLAKWEEIESPATASGCTIKRQEKKEWLLVSINPVEVPAFEKRDIAVYAGLSIRPVSFVVPEEIAEHFDIEHFTIARLRLDGENNGGSAIPASIFSSAYCADCHEKRVTRLVGAGWPIVAIGAPICLTVRNKSPAIQEFRGVFEAIDLTTPMKDGRVAIRRI